MGCAGAPSRPEGPPPPSEREYLLGFGESKLTGTNDLRRVDEARERGDASIGRKVSSRLRSVFKSRTRDVAGRIDRKLEEELVITSQLDESLRGLIVDVPSSRKCASGRCEIMRMLKRSEARAVYDRTLQAELTDFQQHGKKALSRGADLFAFAGDYNSAASAYRSAVTSLYRRRSVDPRAQLNLPQPSADLWSKLSKDRARRLAQTHLTILPLKSLEFRTSTTLVNTPTASGQVIKDASLEEAIRQNLAGAVRSLRLKTEVADRCRAGVQLIPSAKMNCQIRSGFHFCSLELGGVLATCAGASRDVKFWVADSGLRGATQGNNYETLRDQLLKKLSDPKMTSRLAAQLGAHLPVQK